MAAVTTGINYSGIRTLIDAKPTLTRAVSSAPGVNVNANGQGEVKAAADKPRATLVLDVPYYSQLDPQWADSLVFNGNNVGCLVTCIAMILAYYGCMDENQHPVTPATLYDYLVARNGFDAGGNLQPCDFTFGGNTYRRNRGTGSQVTALNAKLLDELTASMPAIVGVTKTSGSNPHHFVVVVGMVSDGTHLMNDPGRSVATQKGDGADRTAAALRGDMILEAAKKAGGQGYHPVRVDTVELV